MILKRVITVLKKSALKMKKKISLKYKSDIHFGTNSIWIFKLKSCFSSDVTYLSKIYFFTRIEADRDQ